MSVEVSVDVPQCKAKSKRTQEQCKRPALRGQTVCYHHGAGGHALQRTLEANVKHGRYSRYAVPVQLAAYERLSIDPDHLSLSDEVTLARAALQAWLQRWETAKGVGGFDEAATPVQAAGAVGSLTPPHLPQSTSGTSYDLGSVPEPPSASPSGCTVSRVEGGPPYVDPQSQASADDEKGSVIFWMKRAVRAESKVSEYDEMFDFGKFVDSLHEKLEAISRIVERENKRRGSMSQNQAAIFVVNVASLMQETIYEHVKDPILAGTILKAIRTGLSGMVGGRPDGGAVPASG